MRDTTSASAGDRVYFGRLLDRAETAGQRAERYADSDDLVDQALAQTLSDTLFDVAQAAVKPGTTNGSVA